MMFLCRQAEFRDGTMSGAMDVDVKDENDEELDLEMNDEEADAKAAGATEAERITDVGAATPRTRDVRTDSSHTHRLPPCARVYYL